MIPGHTLAISQRFRDKGKVSYIKLYINASVYFIKLSTSFKTTKLKREIDASKYTVTECAGFECYNRVGLLNMFHRLSVSQKNVAFLSTKLFSWI